MSIDDRHRDKNGEISRKHGNTLVGTLRKIYGSTFAAGEPEWAKLETVLAKLHETSLTQAAPWRRRADPDAEDQL
jgi:hypothetical protein